MATLKQVAGWTAVCAACIAGEEGLRTVVYLDPVGIPTYCFGETQGAKLGDTFTPEECRKKLGDRVEKDFGPGVDRCIDHALSPTRKAAYVSFAYNVGLDAFCSSTLVRKENSGDARGACDELLHWIYAKGITLPGLVKRRERERELCLADLV